MLGIIGIVEGKPTPTLPSFSLFAQESNHHDHEEAGEGSDDPGESIDSESSSSDDDEGGDGADLPVVIPELGDSPETKLSTYLVLPFW